MKKVCWEEMECKVFEDCPAYKQKLGHMCFSVAGTLCRGEVQGEYREKIDQCRSNCSFYKEMIV